MISDLVPFGRKLSPFFGPDCDILECNVKRAKEAAFIERGPGDVEVAVQSVVVGQAHDAASEARRASLARGGQSAN
jgi:hypothetical protein